MQTVQLFLAEDFEVNVSSVSKTESESKYKWGYKVRLNDLKFIAKIDVTSDKSISQFDNYTLQIGDNLLSFSDLVSRGYNVRIEMPTLNMGVNSTLVNNTNLF